MRKAFRVIKRFTLCIIVLSLVLLGIYAYAFSPDDYSFYAKDYLFDTLSDELSGITIAYFSDLNLTDDASIEHFSEIVDEINEHPFDLIIFGGDLFDDTVFKAAEVASLLKNIECSYGKFALLGDKDQTSTTEVTQILNDGGFEVLKNEKRTIYYNNATFTLIADDEQFDITELELNQDEFTLCIAHTPDTFIQNKGKVTLQISGHSYGGSIYIPYLGALIKEEGAKTYNHGTYSEEGSTLVVSNGVSGPSSFPYKLFARNHIELITLKNK